MTGTVWTAAMACVLLASAQAPGVAMGAPEPLRLGADEVAALGAREKADLARTSWGKVFRGIQKLDEAMVTGAEVAGEEARFFRSIEDPALNETRALGHTSIGRRILCFAPDRALDLLDIISLTLHLGLGGGLEIHFTRWASFGLGAAVCGCPVGWEYNRGVGTEFVILAGAMFGPFVAYYDRISSASTSWKQGRGGAGTKVYEKGGVFSINDPIVQDGRMDPYGIGGGFHQFDIHPVELADFFVGLITLGFVDISADDYANPERQLYKAGLPRNVKPRPPEPEKPGPKAPQAEKPAPK